MVQKTTTSSVQIRSGTASLHLAENGVSYTAEVLLELREIAKNSNQKTLQRLLEISFYEAFTIENATLDQENQQLLRKQIGKYSSLLRDSLVSDIEAETTNNFEVSFEKQFGTLGAARSIQDHATRVFGDALKATNWLNHPRPQFGGKTPQSMLATKSGCAAVEQILGQIEHGMFG